MYHIKEDIERILVTEEQIAAICDRIAAEITEAYKNSDKPLILVTILKGSTLFASDLFRRIPLDCTLEFMKVSSYGAGTSTTGVVEVHLDLKQDVKDANVILIEDIIDSGKTLQRLTQLLEGRGAASVRTCSLLDKPSRRQVEINADYVGMEIPDVFVVGYGLDYNEYYRNLPYVGVLKPAIYES